MSNLIDFTKRFGESLSQKVKLSNYSWFNLGGNAEFFFKPKDKKELLNEYIKHLKIINPEFNENWIKNYVYNSVSAAQPLLPVNYSSLKPSFMSPIRNLYIGNTSQIYPEDRGTNYSVKIAGEIVSLIIKESK